MFCDFITGLGKMQELSSLSQQTFVGKSKSGNRLVLLFDKLNFVFEGKYLR